MIDRVDIVQFENSPAITLTFYYDTECEDTFAVFEPAQVSEIWELLAGGAEPERVLIAIRQFGDFKLH